MSKAGSGLSDKLYWRNAFGGMDGVLHCFKKCTWTSSRVVRGGEQVHSRRHGYISLCSGPHHSFVMNRIGGQAVNRPPDLRRCASCNRAEMQRRGWSEPGPVTWPWLQSGRRLPRTQRSVRA
jgi:hypothetical protein